MDAQGRRCRGRWGACKGKSSCNTKTRCRGTHTGCRGAIIAWRRRSALYPGNAEVPNTNEALSPLEAKTRASQEPPVRGDLTGWQESKGYKITWYEPWI